MTANKSHITCSMALPLSQLNLGLYLILITESVFLVIVSHFKIIIKTNSHQGIRAQEIIKENVCKICYVNNRVTEVSQ